jgi:hypothetical protein
MSGECDGGKTQIIEGPGDTCMLSSGGQGSFDHIHELGGA